MGWYTYFKLLKKYNGNLKKATKEELKEAVLSNPNDPRSALALARKKWEEEQQQKNPTSSVPK